MRAWRSAGARTCASAQNSDQYENVDNASSPVSLGLADPGRGLVYYERFVTVFWSILVARFGPRSGMHEAIARAVHDREGAYRIERSHLPHERLEVVERHLYAGRLGETALYAVAVDATDANPSVAVTTAHALCAAPWSHLQALAAVFGIADDNGAAIRAVAARLLNSGVVPGPWDVRHDGRKRGAAMVRDVVNQLREPGGMVVTERDAKALVDGMRLASLAERIWIGQRAHRRRETTFVDMLRVVRRGISDHGAGLFHSAVTTRDDFSALWPRALFIVSASMSMLEMLIARRIGLDAYSRMADVSEHRLESWLSTQLVGDAPLETFRSRRAAVVGVA